MSGPSLCDANVAYSALERVVRAAHQAIAARDQYLRTRTRLDCAVMLEREAVLREALKHVEPVWR